MEDGVKTHPGEIEKIRSFPSPNNTKIVRSFLGLASYYRRYVHQFAKIAYPVTAILSKQASTKKQFV